MIISDKSGMSTFDDLRIPSSCVPGCTNKFYRYNLPPTSQDTPFRRKITLDDIFDPNTGELTAINVDVVVWWKQGARNVTASGVLYNWLPSP